MILIMILILVWACLVCRASRPGPAVRCGALHCTHSHGGRGLGQSVSGPPPPRPAGEQVLAR